MMHHNLNAFGMGIVVEHLDIEIRIRSDEIEYIKLRMSNPVFPAYVPSFNQHLTQSVFGCEIYIFLYFLIVSSMYAMRFALPKNVDDIVRTVSLISGGPYPFGDMAYLLGIIIIGTVVIVENIFLSDTSADIID